MAKTKYILTSKGKLTPEQFSQWVAEKQKSPYTWSDQYHSEDGDFSPPERIQCLSSDYFSIEYHEGQLGFVARAARDIPAMTDVAYYVGDIVFSHKFSELSQLSDEEIEEIKRNNPRPYFWDSIYLGLKDQMEVGIDAESRSNVARFFPCLPNRKHVSEQHAKRYLTANLGPQFVFHNQYMLVYFITSHDVKKGELLGYDYSEDNAGANKLHFLKPNLQLGPPIEYNIRFLVCASPLRLITNKALSEKQHSIIKKSKDQDERASAGMYWYYLMLQSIRYHQNIDEQTLYYYVMSCYCFALVLKQNQSYHAAIRDVLMPCSNELKRYVNLRMKELLELIEKVEALILECDDARIKLFCAEEFTEKGNNSTVEEIEEVEKVEEVKAEELLPSVDSKKAAAELKRLTDSGWRFDSKKQTLWLVGTDDGLQALAKKLRAKKIEYKPIRKLPNRSDYIIQVELESCRDLVASVGFAFKL